MVAGCATKTRDEDHMAAPERVALLDSADKPDTTVGGNGGNGEGIVSKRLGSPYRRLILRRSSCP